MNRRPPVRRAYSLIEVAVALAISGIVTTIALSAFSNVTRQRAILQLAPIADDNAKAVTGYLARQAQRVGGSMLRPWQALAVEQKPCVSTSPTANFAGTCQPSDRMTIGFLDLNAGASTCEIASLNATRIGFASVTVGSVTGCCPMIRIADDGTELLASSPAEMANRHMLLTAENGKQYQAITLSATQPLTGCSFNYVLGAQVAPLRSSPTYAPTTYFQTTSTISPLGVTTTSTNAGNAVPITAATFYIGCPSGVDCDAHPHERALYVFSDRNGGAGTTLTLDAGDENAMVGPGVIDMQIALGYDLDEDGDVDETVNGADDEWLGNGETTPPTIDPAHLRMISLGVIAAVKVNDRAHTSRAQLVDGLLWNATSLHLRAMTTRVSFRSLSIIE